jgi:hypothetical protein
LTDHATPNLPAIDFEQTSQFYQKLGFEQGWRDDGWMIMTRGDLTLEFFPHSELNPRESCFSCCLRLDDLDGFHSACRSAGIPDACWGWPRLGEPRIEGSGIRIAYMVDPNGSLIRLIQN